MLHGSIVTGPPPSRRADIALAGETGRPAGQPAGHFWRLGGKADIRAADSRHAGASEFSCAPAGGGAGRRAAEGRGAMVSGDRLSGGAAGMRGRRSFLLMAGAVVGGGALSSCARPAGQPAAPAGSGPTLPAQSVLPRPQRPAVTAADWAALRRDLSSHKLIRPGDSGYP